MALLDLTSSWVTGRCCELAARGYSCDGKKGRAQSKRGALRSGGTPGRGTCVFRRHRRPGIVDRDRHVVKDKLGITKLALVGDLGIITTARIDALRELNKIPRPPRISTGSPRYAHP